MQIRQGGESMCRKKTKSMSNCCFLLNMVLVYIFGIEGTFKNISISPEEGTYSKWGVQVGVSGVGETESVCRGWQISSSSLEKKKRLILLGITGRTFGGCSTVAHPHIPTLAPVSPHPSFLCFPVSTNPPSMNRSSSTGTTTSTPAH